MPISKQITQADIEKRFAERQAAARASMPASAAGKGWAKEYDAANPRQPKFQNEARKDKGMKKY